MDAGERSASRAAPRPGPGGPVAVDGRAAAGVPGAATTPWVRDLIARFRTAAGTMRACEHLADDPDQGAVWVAAVPDRRSCRRPACTAAVVATLEDRLGHGLRDEPPRCTTCGAAGVEVRGVGVALGPTMLRGTVCGPCLDERSPAPDPADDEAERGGRRPMALDDGPLVVGPAVRDDADGEPVLDDLARLALRRGALMAEACCRATVGGLDRERAVAGGLMVRAAKLARGLVGTPEADATFVGSLALRALGGTIAALGRALGPVAGDGQTDVADGATDAHHAPGDAPGGSWSELVALHLTHGSAGYALDLEHHGDGPAETIVAAERLALACADYVDGMPTDLDPYDVRRLAAEVTAVRAAVEAGAVGDHGGRPRRTV